MLNVCPQVGKGMAEAKSTRSFSQELLLYKIKELRKQPLILLAGYVVFPVDFNCPPHQQVYISLSIMSVKYTHSAIGKCGWIKSNGPHLFSWVLLLWMWVCFRVSLPEGPGGHTNYIRPTGCGNKRCNGFSWYRLVIGRPGVRQALW